MRRLAFLLPLALAGCVVSDEPLGDVRQSKPDDALVGGWRRQDGDQWRLLVIGRDRRAAESGTVPAGVMACRELHLDDDRRWLDLGDDDQRAGGLFPTTIAGATYASFFDLPTLRATADDGTWSLPAKHHYLIAKYAVDATTLRLWLMDTDAAEAAIARGDLAGSSGRCFLGHHARLTDGRKLAAHLAKGGGKALFPAEPSLVYRRVKLTPAE